MFVITIENLKTLKNHILYILYITLGLSFVHSKCDKEYKKIFREEESIQILEILGLITYIEEYQIIYNHDWRKHRI